MQTGIAQGEGLGGGGWVGGEGKRGKEFAKWYVEWRAI